jgi:hypothetical protein
MLLLSLHNQGQISQSLNALNFASYYITLLSTILYIPCDISQIFIVIPFEPPCVHAVDILDVLEKWV